MTRRLLRTRSLTWLVVAIILSAVALLAMLASIFGYGYYRQHEEQNFIQRLDMAAEQLQTALAPTIWNLDYPQINKLIESRLMDPYLQAIELLLDDRRIAVTRLADGRVDIGEVVEAHGLRETSRVIEFKGQALGTLRIYATTAPLDAELANARLALASFTLILGAVSTLILYWLLSRLIVRPLRVVERYAQTISRGETPASDLTEWDFIGEIDSLKHSVDRMIHELKLRNSELAEHRERLEDQVAARTQELQQTIRQLEETQFAMNHAGIAIQWIDASDGHLLYVNERACTLYGYDRANLLGMRASQLVAELDPVRLREWLPRLQAGGRATIESIAQTRNGPLPIETGVYLQCSPESEATHFITFSTDISQRKAAENALIAAKAAAEAAARTRSEFLANMSHEIRTPMNAIIGMSRLALNTALDGKQRNYIEKVYQAAESLLGILNDILDFSKVEAGRLDIEHVEFDFSELLSNVANVVGLRAEEKGIELVFDIAADIPARLVGDPSRINQVLINLVGNAIKFTEKGSVLVAVRLVEQADDDLILEWRVRDTGIGIDPAQLGQLFSAFSQADASISRRFGGTGLGLAISKRLVELMGGSIGVESALGEGSTFHFTLTLQAGTQGAPLPELPARLQGTATLVVDDCITSREVIANQLSTFGMQADVADSAVRALPMLSQKHYDLLICDWKMPGMDGVELVRSLEERADSHVPAVIMVSAYGIEQLRQAAQGLKLAGILAKPASPSALLDVLLGAFGGPHLPSASSARTALPGTNDYPALRNLPVLLVEDNPINQELAAELLGSVGMLVSIASNGQEALAMLQPGRFACILMDVQMPIMDGLEAARHIRADSRFDDLPIIAMTAGALPEEKAATRAAGMNRHITKPLDFDMLFATLGELLGHAPATPAPTQPPIEPGAMAGPVFEPEKGLKVAANKAAFYHRLLQRYLDTQAERTQPLINAAHPPDPVSLRALAHAIRGSAATLGINITAERAGQLEAACRSGQPDEALLAQVSALIEAEEIARSAVETYLAARVAPA